MRVHADGRRLVASRVLHCRVGSVVPASAVDFCRSMTAPVFEAGVCLASIVEGSELPQAIGEHTRIRCHVTCAPGGEGKIVEGATDSIATKVVRSRLSSAQTAIRNGRVCSEPGPGLLPQHPARLRNQWLSGRRFLSGTNRVSIVPETAIGQDCSYATSSTPLTRSFTVKEPATV